jgi:prepilin-type N-terminal cleavage/methylation domain-containing protein
MKKSGFTLIETMVSIFILSILFSVGTSLSKISSKVVKDINNNQYIYEIQNLLSYGKAVCREKNKYGKITVNSRENQVSFTERGDNIEKAINIPKDAKIFGGDMSALITPDGKISRGDTIIIRDSYGEWQYITIGVGVDLIVIKKGGLK